MSWQGDRKLADGCGAGLGGLGTFVRALRTDGSGDEHPEAGVYVKCLVYGSADFV